MKATGQNDVPVVAVCVVDIQEFPTTRIESEGFGFRGVTAYLHREDVGSYCMICGFLSVDRFGGADAGLIVGVVNLINEIVAAVDGRGCQLSSFSPGEGHPVFVGEGLPI